MDKLRVGVIGLCMGEYHIKGYKEHPGCDVVAICDIDNSRLNLIGDKYNISKRYESAEKMIDGEQLDIVSVATPNKFHAPMTIMALNVGCHVFCEKPMALNAVEAKSMLNAAKKTNCNLIVMSQYVGWIELITIIRFCLCYIQHLPSIYIPQDISMHIAQNPIAGYGVSQPNLQTA